MNTHLKQLWAAMKLPEKLQKSYKFFCRGLDIRVNKTLDTYYDLIEIYKGLDEYDQEMVWSIMQTVKKTGEKRKRDRENTEES